MPYKDVEELEDMNDMTLRELEEIVGRLIGTYGADATLTTDAGYSNVVFRLGHNL